MAIASCGWRPMLRGSTFHSKCANSFCFSAGIAGGFSIVFQEVLSERVTIRAVNLSSNTLI